MPGRSAAGRVISRLASTRHRRFHVRRIPDIRSMLRRWLTLVTCEGSASARQTSSPEQKAAQYNERPGMGIMTKRFVSRPTVPSGNNWQVTAPYSRS